MWYRSPRLIRRLVSDGMPGGMLTPAFATGLAQTADANIFSTRTLDARPETPARPSIFERLHHSACQDSPSRRRFDGGPRVAVRAWSNFNDHAHADRRAPPGRDPGGRDQGKSDRGI